MNKERERECNNFRVQKLWRNIWKRRKREERRNKGERSEGLNTEEYEER